MFFHLPSRCWTLCFPLHLVWPDQCTASVWPQLVWLLDPSVSLTVTNGVTPLKTWAREYFSHSHSFLFSSGDALQWNSRQTSCTVRHTKTFPLHFSHTLYAMLMLLSVLCFIFSSHMSNFLIFLWEDRSF